MVRETPIRNTYVHALANLEQVHALTLHPCKALGRQVRMRQRSGGSLSGVACGTFVHP